MHVLQHTVCVGGRCDTQVLLEARVPGFGQVFHLQLTLHQGDLELHAQHDVQVIGGFVGFHPDERGLDLIDALIEVLQGEVAELCRKYFA